jgi:hypothetical protein
MTLHGLSEHDKVLSPHSYPLDTEIGRLRHALAWTLDSYKRSVAGRGTPMTHVVSFAESVLREAEK